MLETYPLQSCKSLDYVAFRNIHRLIVNKEHLTPEGLDKIQSIKATMNRALAKQVQYKDK